MPKLFTVKFSVVQDSHDTFAVPYEMDARELAHKLTLFRETPEKDGVALIGGQFYDGQRSSHTINVQQLIGLDLELNKKTGAVPPPIDVLSYKFKDRGLMASLYESYNSTSELPRIRCVLYLDKPINPQNLLPGDLDGSRKMAPLIAATCAWQLGLGDYCDQGKFAPASIFYTPRKPPGGHHRAIYVQGTPQSSTELTALAYFHHDKARMSRAQAEALRKSQQFPPEVREKIEAYNDGHEIPELLAEYGYQRHGDRWKSPLQSPGSNAATAIFPDRLMWYSWSESDKDAGLGYPCSEGVFGDPFTLYCFYKFNGNFREALASIGERP